MTPAPGGAAWQELEQPDPIQAALMAGRGYVEPDPGPAWCVNAALFDHLRAVEASDAALATWGRQQLARAMQSRDAAGIGGRPSYSLPRIWGCPGHPSLDTRQQLGRQVPRRKRGKLDPGAKARQRDRYKGALADNLERWARAQLAWDYRQHDGQRPAWMTRKLPTVGPLTLELVDDPNPQEREWPGPAGGRYLRRQRRRRESKLMTPALWILARSRALRSCQEVVALQDAVCGGIAVIPQSCHVRAEPDCEAARQQRVLAAYLAAVEQMDPEWTRFATFTILNRPRDHLAEGLTHLGQALGKLARRSLWRGGRCRDRSTCRQPLDPEKPGWRQPHGKVAASLRTIEITYSAEKGWHPHAHLILESPWLDQAELAATWQAITGDSKVVWVENVRRYAEQRHAGDTEAALRELLKYAAKPSKAFLEHEHPAVIAELLIALRGRRLVSASGRLRRLERRRRAEHLDGAHPQPDPLCPLCDPEQPEALMLVWPDDPRADPYRAPVTCPLHGGPADWRVLGYRRRRDCRPVEARAGPRRSVLALEVDRGQERPAPASRWLDSVQRRGAV